MMFVKRHVTWFIIIAAGLIVIGLLFIKYWPDDQRPTVASTEKTVDIQHALVAQYGLRPSQVFEKTPSLLQRISEINQGFDVKNLAFAADNEVVRLGGQEFLVLRGCPDQDCVGRLTVIFWSPNTDEVYVVRGQDGDQVVDDFQVQIFGQPADSLRQALLYFYSER